MASNTRNKGGSTPTTAMCALAATRSLTLLLIVGAVLVFSGCGASTQAATNDATAPTPTDPSQFAFLRGTHGSFQTTDDGMHWSQPGSFKLSGAFARDMYALSSTTRWEAISTAEGTSSVVTVARTNDDGHTWRPVMLSTFAQPYVRPGAVQFLDATHGWLEVDLSQTHIRHGLLFSTQDGGTTWTSSALPFSGSITFTSYSVGWLVGSNWATLNNTLLGTHDGGKTWMTQTLPLPHGITPSLTVVGLPRFFDQQNGIAPVNVGQSTVLYATHNGGASWAQTATLPNATGDDQALPVDASAGRSAWVVVGHSLFATHDAGATWAAVQHDTHLTGALDVGMRSDTKGYALTENGTCASFKSNCTIQTAILRTTDGGHTWLPSLVSAQ